MSGSVGFFGDPKPSPDLRLLLAERVGLRAAFLKGSEMRREHVGVFCPRESLPAPRHFGFPLPQRREFCLHVGPLVEEFLHPPEVAHPFGKFYPCALEVSLFGRQGDKIIFKVSPPFGGRVGEFVRETVLERSSLRLCVPGRFPRPFSHLRGDAEPQEVAQEVRAFARFGVQKAVEGPLR